MTATELVLSHQQSFFTSQFACLDAVYHENNCTKFIQIYSFCSETAVLACFFSFGGHINPCTALIFAFSIGMNTAFCMKWMMLSDNVLSVCMYIYAAFR